MPAPAPIEPIHFDEPRAVQIREGDDLKSFHSAVHGGINVYVDTLTEAQTIIDAWDMIMHAAADKANEILAAARAPQPQEPQPQESNG